MTKTQRTVKRAIKEARVRRKGLKSRNYTDQTDAERQAWRDSALESEETRKARTQVKADWHRQSMQSVMGKDPEWVVTLTADADRQKRQLADERRLAQVWESKSARFKTPLPRENFGRVKASALRKLREAA